MSEVERQKWYYNRKDVAISVEPGDLILAKAVAYRGGGKRRISGRKNHTKWSAKLWKVSLPTSWRSSGQDTHGSSTKIDFPHCSNRGDSSLYGCTAKVGQVHQHHPIGTNSTEEWDWGSTTKCKLSITGPASDRWDSSRMGWQETLCIHADVFQSFLDR